MIRKCFLTGEYIFFAEERAKRPQNYAQEKISKTPVEFCPFCLENEYMTPKRVFATEDESIRIVPNKYPFVSVDDSNHFGIHEVLIDTLNHEAVINDFSNEHMFKLMKAIKTRLLQLEENEKVKYVQIFKNQGIQAGASQSHSHWQIAALSVIPPKYETMFSILSDYYIKNKRCYFCDLKFDDRIIEENEFFTSFVPYDAKFPYEINILPKEHIFNFKMMNDDLLYKFGEILKNSILRLTGLFKGISYNICFYNSAKKENINKYMHFYAQIIPRIGHMAGFEFSTGCFINSILPEKAAKMLRQ